jgi:hypothetical protein
VPAAALDEASDEVLDEVLDAVSGESWTAAQVKGFGVLQQVSCTENSSPGSPKADRRTTTAMELPAHEVMALESRCQSRS